MLLELPPIPPLLPHDTKIKPFPHPFSHPTHNQDTGHTCIVPLAPLAQPPYDMTHTCPSFLHLTTAQTGYSNTRQTETAHQHGPVRLPSDTSQPFLPSHRPTTQLSYCDTILPIHIAHQRSPAPPPSKTTHKPLLHSSQHPSLVHNTFQDNIAHIPNLFLLTI